VLQRIEAALRHVEVIGGGRRASGLPVGATGAKHRGGRGPCLDGGKGTKILATLRRLERVTVKN